MNNQRGFTLVEVMIAVAVLTIAVLGIATMQVVAIQVNARSGRIGNSSDILQDRMETLMTLPFNHADLVDTTPVGQCEAHEDLDPPTNYMVRWCVDDSADGETKNIDLAATYHHGDTAKDLTFTLSLVRTIFHK